MLRITITPIVAAALLAGCTTGPERETSPDASAGQPTGTDAPGQMADERLQHYVDVRRQLASQDPQMAQAFESGDLSGRRSTLEAALAGAVAGYAIAIPRSRIRSSASLVAKSTCACQDTPPRLILIKW
jgi:hypothetical protein